jgi:uncharacterized protein (DUF58 family)
MTASWRLVAGISIALVCAGFLLGGQELLIIAIPYIVFMIIPVFLPRNEPRMEVNAKGELAEILEGGECQLVFTITNRGPSQPFLHFEVSLPHGIRVKETARLFTRLEHNETVALHLTAAAGRGRYDFAGIDAHAGDGLGLAERKAFFPALFSLFVLPTTYQVNGPKIIPRRTLWYPGSVRSGTTGSGAEFYGTRAYAAGDTLRHINRKAAALWGQFVTNLFEEEKAVTVGLILDARSSSDTGVAGGSLFDQSVRIMASLARFFLQAGNRVGLLCYGRMLEWVFPAYGRAQHARILSALCQATPGDHPAFSEFRNLPIRLFPPRSQMVFVSPLQAEDLMALRYLIASGFSVLVISPDPLAFELETLPRDENTVLAHRILRMRREALFASMRLSGVRVIDGNVFLGRAAEHGTPLAGRSE